MNLVMHNLRRRKNQGLRRLIVTLVLISFNLPSPATAVSMGQLQGMSGFRAMVMAIANLNIAMQQATINPQDVERRNRVAIAYGMMPLAITALAKEFQKGKLHDGADFQFVQGILGGFVQKDLNSRVESFMKDPSRQNIPSVGAGFPQDAFKQAEDTYIVGVKERSSLWTENEDGTPKNPGIALTDLVNLNNAPVSAEKKAANIQESKISAKDESTIVGDLSRSALNEKAKETFRSNTAQSASDKSAQESSVEISANEAEEKPVSLGSSTVRAPASKDSLEDSEESLDKNFFKNKNNKKKPTQERSNKKPRKGNAFKEGSLFQGSRKQVLAYVWEILFPAASADPAPAPSPGLNNNQNGSGCNNGECGGQGGGAGGGGGGQAANILFGLAAMIAAAAPMVVAGIQANADKKIAQINANTAITNANTQAALQKYNTDKQTGLAMFQAQATQQIAQQKNDKEMAQLQMQLGALAQQQQQQNALAQAKFENEIRNQQQDLYLKQMQAAQTIELARQQSIAAEVAQGLSTGMQTVRDPSGRLIVSQTPIVGGLGVRPNNTGVLAANSNPNGSLASNTVATNTGSTATGFRGPGLNGTSVALQPKASANGSLASIFKASGQIQGNTISGSLSLAARPKTVNALLASATQPRSFLVSKSGIASKKSPASPFKMALLRGISGAAAGSTEEDMNRGSASADTINRFSNNSLILVNADTNNSRVPATIEGNHGRAAFRSGMTRSTRTGGVSYGGE